MSVTELYERVVRPLPHQDRLRLAAIILNDVASADEQADDVVDEGPQATEAQDDIDLIASPGIFEGRFSRRQTYERPGR